VKNIFQFRSYVSSIFSSCSVVLSYYVSQKYNPNSAFLLIFSSILGGVAGERTAQWLARLMTGNRRIRYFLASPYNIEGYWDIETWKSSFDLDNPSNNSSELTNKGIMLISYHNESDQFYVTVSRINKNGKIFTTISESCNIYPEGKNIKYLNHFKLSQDEKDIICMCEGKFASRNINSKDVNFFSATVYAEQSAPRRQRAIKIHDSIINEYKNMGGDWQVNYILNPPNNPIPL
jgi:hypothetical protein